MQLQEVESMKLLEWNDPSASIAHDVVANVAPADDVSAVTNESNNFTRIFVLT